MPTKAGLTGSAILHPMEGMESCTNCHQVGGAGVANKGGTGMPADHLGRIGESCRTCHRLP